jgi:hypothetical protein
LVCVPSPAISAPDLGPNPRLKKARDDRPIRASRRPPPTFLLPATSLRRRISAANPSQNRRRKKKMPLLPRRRPAALLLPARGFLEARVPWARDRALDHAVERERHLVPFLLTKDALLVSTPPPHAVPLHSLRPPSRSRSGRSGSCSSTPRRSRSRRTPSRSPRRSDSPRCTRPRSRPWTPPGPTPPTGC